MSHTFLVHKLHRYGITAKVNAWTESFLIDRDQPVANGTRDGPAPIDSGVDQGCVLGPSLFLLYPYDLPTGLSSTSRAFADDTICHKKVTCTKYQQPLQQDLDKLTE